MIYLLCTIYSDTRNLNGLCPCGRLPKSARSVLYQTEVPCIPFKAETCRCQAVWFKDTPWRCVSIPGEDRSVYKQEKVTDFPLFLLTCVWWQIEISKLLAFFSTHIFTLQQLLEDPVKILFLIPYHFPRFGGGSQKCTQGTPPVKARNSPNV